MAFLSFLQAASGKGPVWVYDITFGDVAKRYVHGPADITIDGNIYEASAGFHTRPRITADIKRASCDLVFPSTNTFARAFLNARAEETSVSIRQYFRQDPDQELVYAFQGRVVSAVPSIVTTTLRCEAAFTRLRRKGLVPVMQRPCRHALYGPGCGVNIADFQASMTATDWTSPVLTVTGADAEPDGYYTGGVVTYDNSLRWIVGHTGTALTLDQPILGLDEELDDLGSATVLVAPGCDRTRATCQAKFSNIENFGGYDFMTGEIYDGVNVFT